MKQAVFIRGEKKIAQGPRLMHIFGELHMKLVVVIGEALPERAQLGPALRIRTVPIR